MHQLADRSSPDHVTGSYSLLVQIYLKSAPCPSDYVGTSAKVSLTSTVRNKNKYLQTLEDISPPKKSIKHRSYYNASNENLQKFVNLHTWVEEKKKRFIPNFAGHHIKFQQMGAGE